ncbi:MAG: hypothetical protein RL095_3399 [Verrucomicrobiota bacterium]
MAQRGDIQSIAELARRLREARETAPAPPPAAAQEEEPAAPPLLTEKPEEDNEELLPDIPLLDRNKNYSLLRLRARRATGKRPESFSFPPSQLSVELHDLQPGDLPWIAAPLRRARALVLGLESGLEVEWSISPLGESSISVRFADGSRQKAAIGCLLRCEIDRPGKRPLCVDLRQLQGEAELAGLPCRFVLSAPEFEAAPGDFEEAQLRRFADEQQRLIAEMNRWASHGPAQSPLQP